MLRPAVALLLFSLAAASAHAQTVTFSACNPGTVDVDVYFAQGSNVVTQHVGPADCATLASTTGPMAPGVAGVGFPDTQGQWGGVHRMEHVPNFGSKYVDSTKQTIPVVRGGTRTSIPAQFSLRPPKPICVTNTYQEQVPGGGTVARNITHCDDFVYTLNVLAFPDTREVAFLDFCEPCEKKQEAQKTPEELATEKRADDVERALNRMVVSSGALNDPVVGAILTAPGNEEP